jgi:endo-1,4-beta-xylanase
VRSISQLARVLSGLLFLHCAANDSSYGTGSGGSDSRGGSIANPGGSTASGGRDAGSGGSSGGSSGGRLGEGGSGVPPSGGATAGKGGSTSPGGGNVAAGGTGPSSGGSTPQPGTGGAGTGGRAAGGSPPVTGGVGGAASGGAAAGGKGGAATGGKGGGTAGAPSTPALDCSAIPAMPTGGTDHCGQNTQGNAGGQAWSLWCNSLSSSACITTFSTPAFTARWNNNNDFLARVGLEFGNSGKTFDQYGTLKADFAFTKNGSAGNFSYIGIYGWTTNPCVEWYIVDDRYGTFPFDAFNATLKGTTAAIDGEVYKLFQNGTTGSGGSRCSGVSQWEQYWSIRQKGRQCGTITISDHFKAWEAAGMTLGNLLEAKILVETGGGTGSIDFPYAKVTAE